MTVAVAVLVW